MTRYKIQQVKRSDVTGIFFVSSEFEKELDTDEEAIALMEAEKNNLAKDARGVNVVRYAGCGTDNYDRWDNLSSDFE